MNMHRAPMMLTACQIRMARAALRWSINELARNSGVSEKTIRRIEAVFGFPANVTSVTFGKLQCCFEAQGLSFIPEDGGPEGPGVRFGLYPGRQPARDLATLDEVSTAFEAARDDR